MGMSNHNALLSTGRRAMRGSHGQAGGRSKHRTQARQGDGSIGSVAAPVADSPTEAGEFAEPQFSHLWHRSDL